jgi:WhiB family redox-sensing transcriptional regulator
MINTELGAETGDSSSRLLHPQAFETLCSIFGEEAIPTNISMAGAAAIAEELGLVYMESMNGEPDKIREYAVQIADVFRRVMAGEDMRVIAHDMGHRTVKSIVLDIADVRVALQRRSREDFDGRLLETVIDVCQDGGENPFVQLSLVPLRGQISPDPSAPAGRRAKQPDTKVHDAIYPEDLVDLQAQSAAREAAASPSKLPWYSRGLCAFVADNEIFFPPKESGPRYRTEIQRAKRVCGACAVRAECLEAAIANNDFGIRAGTITTERKAEKKRRRAAAAQSQTE